jgi:hypothetical protein
MRKLKIIEHISLDGVIQASGEDGDFPYGDWTAPYRTAAIDAMTITGIWACGSSHKHVLGPWSAPSPFDSRSGFTQLATGF